MKKLTKLSLLAMASLALSGPAWAQTVAVDTTTDDDLILSFRIWNGTSNPTGTDSNLEVDLGSVSQFVLGGTGFTNSASANLNVADLVSTYGQNWASSGDLAFEGAGATTSTNTGYDFVVTQSGLLPQADGSSATPSKAIVQVSSTLSGINATGNSTGAGVVGDSSQAADSINGSYSYEEFHGTTTATKKDYSFFNEVGGLGTTETKNLSDTEAAIDDVGGVTSTSLDLYYYDGSDAPVLQGAFTLTDTGGLSYTAAPEPSTWAMMAGGLGLLFLAIRRRWISILS